MVDKLSIVLVTLIVAALVTSNILLGAASVVMFAGMFIASKEFRGLL